MIFPHAARAQPTSCYDRSPSLGARSARRPVSSIVGSALHDSQEKGVVDSAGICNGLPSNDFSNTVRQRTSDRSVAQKRCLSQSFIGKTTAEPTTPEIQEARLRYSQGLLHFLVPRVRVAVVVCAATPDSDASSSVGFGWFCGEGARAAPLGSRG